MEVDETHQNGPHVPPYFRLLQLATLPSDLVPDRAARKILEEEVVKFAATFTGDVGAEATDDVGGGKGGLDGMLAAELGSGGELGGLDGEEGARVLGDSEGDGGGRATADGCSSAPA